jgi:hypothetical protein
MMRLIKMSLRLAEIALISPEWRAQVKAGEAPSDAVPDRLLPLL